MINNNKIMKCFSALLMLLATSFSFAQGFDEEVIDNTPAGPIDNYVILVLFLALLFAFYKIRRVGSEKVFC